MKKSDVKNMILQLVEETGRFPQLGELADALQITRYQAQRVLALMVEDGFLVRTPNHWYRVKEADTPADPSGIPTVRFMANTERFAAAIKKAGTIINKTEHKLRQVVHRGESGDPVLGIIRWSMAVIGMGAAVISVYYTSVWMFEFLPGILAFTLSSIMVGFSVMAFEVIVAFLAGRVTDHWARWGLSAGFLLLWLVVTVFSITSTVAGQYNRHVQTIEAAAGSDEGRAAGVVRWSTIQEQKTEITQRIQDKREQLRQLNTLVAGVGDLETREAHGRMYVDTQWRIQQAEKAIDGLTTELDRVREAERAEMARDPGVAGRTRAAGTLPDFYTWVAQVLAVDRDRAQFWVYLFPAVFVDLIAPVALGLAFFIGRKKAPGETPTRG